MIQLLTKHEQELIDLSQLMNTVHTTTSSGIYVQNEFDRTVIAEACFLKMFISLEEFLESAFFLLLMGGATTTGWQATTYARPPSDEHAQNMLVGTNRYVDWSTPDTVTKFADLYFANGDPFKTPIAGSIRHWQNMKTVRNSTAHKSQSTISALASVHTSWTGDVVANPKAYDTLMAEHITSKKSFYATSNDIVLAIMRAVANR